MAKQPEQPDHVLTVAADVRVDAKGSGTVVQKNGENYIQITNLKTKIKVGDSKVKIDVKDDARGALGEYT